MSTALALIEKQEQVLKAPETQQQFVELLGSRSQHFVASILGILSENETLAKCDPNSIKLAAMKGAALDLSFDQSLGEAYMLPFRGKATFVPGYKGLTQLCLRTGQFESIGVKDITSRMLKELRELITRSANPSTEIIRYLEGIDFFPELKEGKVEGFCAYFRLTNGFSKYLFWTKKQCLDHAQKYSPSWNKSREEFTDFSAWRSHEDAMCAKTVYRQLILKDAPKSKELHSAIEAESSAEQVLSERPLPMIEGGNETDDDMWEPASGKRPNTLTDAQLDLMRKIMQSHVFTEQERAQVEAMLVHPATDNQVFDGWVKWAQKTSSDRKKAETAAKNAQTTEAEPADPQAMQPEEIESGRQRVASVLGPQQVAVYDEAIQAKNWDTALDLIAQTI